VSRILIFSPQGDGVGLALQLMSEGHSVLVHFVDENDAKQGKGLLWVSQDWQADARQADFVIFDANKFGGYADNLRKDGVKVWNGGVLADRLEMDRKFAMAVMRKSGIPIPPSHDFSNYAEAKKIIESEFEEKERPVIKLNDNAGCATSYVSRNKADMLSTIEAWDKDGLADLSKGGIVQEKIEGAEISVEGWWNGEEFMYPFNVTLERKKLLNDDRGPQTGCSWNFVQNLKPKRPRIARTFLEPLAPLLKKGYVGQIDVNMIVDDDGQAYALEFTSRLGWDASPTLVQGLPGYGEAAARALGLSEGKSLIAGAENPFDALVAVRLWLPPYPWEAKTKPMGKEVYGCLEGVPVNTNADLDRFLPYDCAMNGDDTMVVAGTCGVIGIALGHGKTLDSAIRMSYDAAEAVECPNLCYRTDGGEAVKEDLPRIKRHGWLD